MGPKSRTLFHFTRSLEFLKGILTTGFYPRYCLEDTRYIGLDYYGIPMTCFCDIPMSRISDHTAFYGEYGIGMTKEWGSKNKLEPLIYVSPVGAVPDFLNYLMRTNENEIHDTNKHIYHELTNHFTRIMVLTKPLSGNMLIGGKAVEKDFYQENEWRYVPDGCEGLSQGDFDKEKDARNLELTKRALPFTPVDVKYLFVKSDSEIPAIFDFIQKKLGHWPLNDIKILSTRITSLETIAKDL